MERRAGGLAHSREECGNFSGTQVLYRRERAGTPGTEERNADIAIIADIAGNGKRKTEERIGNTEYVIRRTTSTRITVMIVGIAGNWKFETAIR
jgi:hypothetical protein